LAGFTEDGIRGAGVTSGTGLALMGIPVEG
jgi:hypothetical protein